MSQPSPDEAIRREHADALLSEPIVQPLAAASTPTLGAAPLLRALTGLVWILWGLRFYVPTFVVGGAAEAGLAYSVLGVFALAIACLPLSERWAHHMDLVLLLGTILAISLWTRSAVFASPAYGTDEVAFDQGAAQLLLQGHNPYGVDLTWTLDAFKVLPSGTTNTLSGGFADSLSYPAGSFLVYVPLLVAGLHAQAAIYVDALFWALGMIALWCAMPRPFRPIVPIVASFGVYIDYATGGVTDSLMVPFLVAALWRWDRFGDPAERGPARWLGPIALGLACTFKQSAWFLAPFLVIAVGIESLAGRRGWRPVVRYVALVGLTFLIPNLPFILWDPGAWLAGVLLPLTEPLVPFGQGFVALSTYLFHGSGNLAAYTVAGAAMLLAACGGLVGWYPVARRVVPALPLLALLLPTRSLNSYFVYAIPGLLVALTTIRPFAGDWLGSRVRRWIPRMAALSAAGVGIVALALAVTSPAPLVLEPVSEHTTGQLQTVDALEVTAYNRSDRAVEPHFAVALGAYLSSYWMVHEGPAVLPAGATARYVLWAPNTPSMPAIDQQSVLYALTPQPATISSAPLFAGTTERVQISPQAVNQVVRDPAEVAFSVQLVDRLNNPVSRAGVGVRLGQVIYAAEGLIPGETSINGRAEGQSPVVALTNSNGVASFTVRAIQQQPFEVFYQAWLADPFPHGYSTIVAVRFDLGGTP